MENEVKVDRNDFYNQAKKVLETAIKEKVKTVSICSESGLLYDNVIIMCGKLAEECSDPPFIKVKYTGIDIGGKDFKVFFSFKQPQYDLTD